MKYSILPKDPAKEGKLGDVTLYHLSLDRAFSVICPRKEEKEYFLSVLSHPLICPDAILERQEILKDFIQSPSLLFDLTDLYSRFHKLLVSNKEADKGNLHIQANRMQSPDSIKNQLQIYALYCKQALLFVKALGQLLLDTPIRARRLITLRDGFLQISRAPDFQTMISYCSKFENFSTSSALDFRISLGEDGYIAGAEWIEHGCIHITDPDLKAKKGLLFHRKPPEAHPCVRLFPSHSEYYEKMMLHALGSLSDFFRSVTNSIAVRFGSVYKELTFYAIALRYTKKLENMNIQTVFPGIRSEKESEFDTLYDLYLSLSTDHVVPNNAQIDPKGVLVFGENGSGKTVFLRSLACAQILSQSGLPIPAKSANIKPYTAIVTQFSGAEKEPAMGENAGRFENEVKAIAQLFSALTPNTLVFFNETFQSTAYDEGAEGLFPILNYLTDRKIKWVLVTHLKGLLPKCKENGSKILYTDGNYQVGPTKQEKRS